MIFSKLFLIFTFKDKNMAENCINIAENHREKTSPCGVSGITKMSTPYIVVTLAM